MNSDKDIFCQQEHILSIVYLSNNNKFNNVPFVFVRLFDVAWNVTYSDRLHRWLETTTISVVVDRFIFHVWLNTMIILWFLTNSHVLSYSDYILSHIESKHSVFDFQKLY